MLASIGVGWILSLCGLTGRFVTDYVTWKYISLIQHFDINVILYHLSTESRQAVHRPIFLSIKFNKSNKLVPINDKDLHRKSFTNPSASSPSPLFKGEIFK